MIKITLKFLQTQSFRNLSHYTNLSKRDQKEEQYWFKLLHTLATYKIKYFLDDDIRF
jgi:hypothetical protein